MRGAPIRLAQGIPVRYYIPCLTFLVCLCLVVFTTHGSSGESRSVWLSNKIPNLAMNTTKCMRDDPVSLPSLEGDEVPQQGHRPQVGCVNATFVILARNTELSALVETLMEMEAYFNHRYHYPYTFLNDQPFSEEFKAVTSKLVSSKVTYGLIPREQWVQPDFIDEAYAEQCRHRLMVQGVQYAESIPYRNMCRFNSGFFFRHELLQPYRYYWRIEPGVRFFCHVEEDPFLFMQENKKIYGFTITLYEFEKTIPTLWDATMEFMREYPEYIAQDNAMAYVSDNSGRSYNLCHFWSNFEIADMEFWRSEAYLKYFEFLDEKGGFYYERWGDAPVHSLAVSLLARKDEIHFFEEIGYRHSPFQHCPQGKLHVKRKCSCDGRDNFDYNGYSCLKKFDRIL